MKRRLMEQAAGGDEQAGAGGAVTNDQAADQNQQQADQSQQSAAADQAKAEADKSALAGGENKPAIPEKYQVKKEDGTLDVEASSLKLAEAYKHLETKLGSGDLPPASADDYTVTPPEEYADVFSKDDPLLQDFLKGAHEVALTQKQADYVLGQYFKIAPQLLEGGAANTVESATAALGELWKDPKERQENVAASYRASVALASKEGLTFDDVEKAGLGNNPVFIRLMASLDKEMRQPTPPNDTAPAGGANIATETDYQALIKSEAYLDGKHPDHGKALQQATAWRKRTHPETA
ncbi:MAG TPA: hypothetical protein VN023_09525 [Methylovorus sp.]|nr:hypothetical protein [Methylovorus sp.]